MTEHKSSVKGNGKTETSVQVSGSKPKLCLSYKVRVTHVPAMMLLHSH